MIREVLRPDDTSLTINIPQEYVGKQIEYIIFPITENSNSDIKNTNNISSLKGVLNKYADHLKIELEDQAWKLHIKDKYKIND